MVGGCLENRNMLKGMTEFDSLAFLHFREIHSLFVKCTHYGEQRLMVGNALEKRDNLHGLMPFDSTVLRHPL